jgi:glycosyltransferase involved in cell wall biosynthesis
MITYVLLSPTFGMHQYTADLANRAVEGRFSAHDRPEAVQVVTTANAPRDRYCPGVELVTPVTTHGTGFSREGADLAAYRKLQSVVFDQALAAPHSSVVHFAGVHAWNVPLVYALRRRRIRVVHTLHDLAPHSGVRHGVLIRFWNRLIISSGATILVHGARYREELVAQGVPPARVVYTPLLHGFLGAAWEWPPQPIRRGEAAVRRRVQGVTTLTIPDGSQTSLAQPHNSVGMPRPYGRDHDVPIVLFFGRVEPYKGVEVLIEAWASLSQSGLWERAGVRELVIAGPVARGVDLGPLPTGVTLLDRRIDDAEADALFRRASLLVLPYRDATQSALIAAAYAYGLPVIVTRTGALPEYVIEGETGWVVAPGDAAALARALSACLAGSTAKPERVRQRVAAGREWFDERRAEEEDSLTRLYCGLAP